jgi:pimeloyl-ACP methyl ester carboxylesterase
MPYFWHDSTWYHYREEGAGHMFVFQHGLGADVQQPLALVGPAHGYRVVAFDFRAHGLTHPTGPHERLNFDNFADDLAALMDHMGVRRAVVGGISLGAAVSLKFALRHADRALGLVQLRPAWGAGPNLENAKRYACVASLLREFGAERGKVAFRRSALYREMEIASPEAAKSLLAQFDSRQAVRRAARLERLPLDAPIASLHELRRLRIPVLVMATRQDAIHDFAYGEAMAAEISGAEFHELTPKSVSVEQYSAEVRMHVRRFLGACAPRFSNAAV